MEGDQMVSYFFDYSEDVIIHGESGQEYKIDKESHLNLLSIFDDIFPSTYTVTNSTDMTLAKLRFQQYRTSGYRLRNGSYNPFLYDNITTHLDHFVGDLTNIARSAKKTTEMVEGPSYDLVSVVEVRWEWLSLPLSLLGLTFIFMVATILRSSVTQDVGVWKTSAIATLLYGLPDNVRTKVTSATNHGTPRANAKRTKVKWLPGTGWRLSGGSTFSPSSLRARHSPPQPEWKAS